MGVAREREREGGMDEEKREREGGRKRAREGEITIKDQTLSI